MKTNVYLGPRLLVDYQPRVVPNHLKRLLHDHRANVKCVTALGSDLAVSGSRSVLLDIGSSLS